MARLSPPTISGLKDLPSREAVLLQAAKLILASPMAEFLADYHKDYLEKLVASEGKPQYGVYSIRVELMKGTIRSCSLLLEWSFQLSEGTAFGLDADTGDEYFTQPAMQTRITLPAEPDIYTDKAIEWLTFYKEVAEFGQLLEKALPAKAAILMKTAQGLLEEQEKAQQMAAMMLADRNSKGLRVGGTSEVGPAPEPLQAGKKYLVTTPNHRVFRVEVAQDGSAQITRQA